MGWVIFYAKIWIPNVVLFLILSHEYYFDHFDIWDDKGVTWAKNRLFVILFSMLFSDFYKPIN